MWRNGNVICSIDVSPAYEGDLLSHGRDTFRLADSASVGNIRLDYVDTARFLLEISLTNAISRKSTYEIRPAVLSREQSLPQLDESKPSGHYHTDDVQQLESLSNAGT
jgi:hypothetical protein